MIIDSSAIAMSAGHQFNSTHRKEESIQVWVDPPETGVTVDTISLSMQTDSAAKAKAQKIPDGDEIVESNPKLLLIKELIEALTGEKIRLVHADPIQSGAAKEYPEDTTAQTESPKDGWGLRYDYKETYSESEQTSFTAAGSVKTADGRELAFDFNLKMSREFMDQTGISIRAGDATRVDPLVINFAGNAAELTDWTFKFDLDANGSKEEIPFVTQGSGLLAFDRNGDGQINNGAELFGPSTGNGFQELSALDQDGNGWIDENDAAYAGLKIWTLDQAGNQTLMNLKDIGIGAVNLSYASSPFDLRDQNNTLKGQIIRTGIYLAEPGQAGSVQQLDFFV